MNCEDFIDHYVIARCIEPDPNWSPAPQKVHQWVDDAIRIWNNIRKRTETDV